MNIDVRRFAPREWRVYRELRLRALADSPDAFGSIYTHEAARTDAEWEDRLTTGATAPGQMPVLALIGETPVGLAWAAKTRKSQPSPMSFKSGSHRRLEDKASGGCC